MFLLRFLIIQLTISVVLCAPPGEDDINESYKKTSQLDAPSSSSTSEASINGNLRLKVNELKALTDELFSHSERTSYINPNVIEENGERLTIPDNINDEMRVLIDTLFPDHKRTSYINPNEFEEKLKISVRICDELESYHDTDVQNSISEFCIHRNMIRSFRGLGCGDNHLLNKRNIGLELSRKYPNMKDVIVNDSIQHVSGCLKALASTYLDQLAELVETIFMIDSTNRLPVLATISKPLEDSSIVEGFNRFVNKTYNNELIDRVDGAGFYEKKHHFEEIMGPIIFDNCLALQKQTAAIHGFFEFAVDLKPDLAKSKLDHQTEHWLDAYHMCSYITYIGLFSTYLQGVYNVDDIVYVLYSDSKMSIDESILKIRITLALMDARGFGDSHDLVQLLITAECKPVCSNKCRLEYDKIIEHQGIAFPVIYNRYNTELNKGYETCLGKIEEDVFSSTLDLKLTQQQRELLDAFSMSLGNGGDILLDDETQVKDLDRALEEISDSPIALEMYKGPLMNNKVPINALKLMVESACPKLRPVHHILEEYQSLSSTKELSQKYLNNSSKILLRSIKACLIAFR